MCVRSILTSQIFIAINHQISLYLVRNLILVSASNNCVYLRFEVLTAAKMSIVVFWVVRPCGTASCYKRFEATYRCTEDEVDKFLRNASYHLQGYTASQPKRQQPINCVYSDIDILC
jgi:hypothetical protein